MLVGLQGIAISFLWFMSAFGYIGSLGFRKPQENIVKHGKLFQDCWCQATQDLTGPRTGEMTCSCAHTPLLPQIGPYWKPHG